jgi:uncharacterized coiled-coil protein SlyX
VATQEQIQEQILADLQKRVAALEQRANNQSVRMSTIDDHIKRLEKDMAVPKLAVGDAPQIKERLTQLEEQTEALKRM